MYRIQTLIWWPCPVSWLVKRLLFVSNKNWKDMLNSVVVLLALEALFGFIVWLIGGTVAAALAIAIIFVLAVLAYVYSGSAPVRWYKAKPLEDPEIKAIADALALDARVKPPSVLVVENETINSFAVRRYHGNAAIALTRGLLSLEKQEIKAAIAHELVHISNRDTPELAFGAAVGMAFSWLAERGYAALFSTGERKTASILWMLPVAILGPIGAFFVRASVGRGIEAKADYMGAMLVKDPKSMASVLRKASIAEKKRIGPACGTNLFIVTPFKRDWFTRLFDCHPPVERRIETLEVMRLGG